MKHEDSSVLFTLTVEEYELKQIVDAVIFKCKEDKTFLHLLGNLLKVAGTKNDVNMFYSNYWKEADEKRKELLDEI